ncbi:protein of unknown function [Poseidonocella pacifica]|uniref:DUF4389 domain-containing protein n=1 Tax=Poseidonocella pacifica TaxID=871651 RepID=A0A1I0V8M2_9RHOB|nr:DUF4389 domain-containing protein [Poseidonocella pacifica]SFA72618.1 protein of unknown function [Poseidonocella pacifica]
MSGEERNHDPLEGRVHGERDEPETRDGMLLRLIYSVLILVMINLAQTVLIVVTVIQYVVMLVHKRPNERVSDFGLDLGVWIAKAARYLTGGSEEKPWPWSDLD